MAPHTSPSSRPQSGLTVACSWFNRAGPKFFNKLSVLNPTQQPSIDDTACLALLGMVAEGAQQWGRDASTIDLVARVNVCVHDDRHAAWEAMKPGIARSLIAQAPDFFTFTQAGLRMPSALREKVSGLPYTHDPAPLRMLAAEIPGEFVEALTLAGPPAEVAAGVLRLARGDITQFILAPVAPDGHIELTIERFQAEVMPHVRQELAE